MRIPKVGMIGMAILGAVGLAGAHLASGSLSIKGGESFPGGAQQTITWKVTNSHGQKIGIAISSDGGTNWTSLKADLPDPAGDNSFKVTLPAEPTTHAKIRVCQASTVSTCDTVSASYPSGPGGSQQPPYSLVSGEFTITGTSAIVPAAASAYALGFERGSGKLAVTFDLVRGESVTLQVVDFKGRVQATLLDGVFAVGAHKLSLALPQELASNSALIFRFKLGETVRTQSVTRP
jgi:hypothetical protein